MENIKNPILIYYSKYGENARHKNKIAEEIGIQENYLTGCNKKAMLMYLIHLNNPEKTQYSTQEVKGELRKELEKLITKRMDSEIKMEALYNLINEKDIKEHNQLIKIAIEYHLVDTLRQNQFLLSKLIEEKRNKKSLIK